MMSNQWGIIGHDWAVDLLRLGVESGRIGHAYLIAGAAHLGRTTLALALAKALNCTSEYVNNRPCGQCRSCKLIANGRHPDVFTLEPQVSGRGFGVIKIDQIRELQRSLNLATIEARYKIAIIRSFDAANLSAANAFLKTLEEPPPNVILILTASDADALLQTITSRCRTVSLRPVATPVIQHLLETRYGQLTPQAHTIAHLANGRIGWAIQAVEEPRHAADHQAAITQLMEILAGKRVDRFAIVNKLYRHGESLPALLQAWSSWWRDALLVGIHGQTAGDRLINLDEFDRLTAVQEHLERDDALHALKATEEAQWQLAHNGNIRLVLEVLFLNYPFLSGALATDPA